MTAKSPTYPETAAEVPNWRCPNCGGSLEYCELQNAAYCCRCDDLIHRSEVDTAEDWDAAQ